MDPNELARRKQQVEAAIASAPALQSQYATLLQRAGDASIKDFGAEINLLRTSVDLAYAKRMGTASDIQGLLSRGGTKEEAMRRYGITSDQEYNDLLNAGYEWARYQNAALAQYSPEQNQGLRTVADTPESAAAANAKQAALDAQIADVRATKLPTNTTYTAQTAQGGVTQQQANIASKYTPLPPSALSKGTTLKESDIARTTGVNIYKRDLAAEQAAMAQYSRMYGAPKTDAEWRKFHDFVYEGKGVNPTAPSVSSLGNGVPSGTMGAPNLSEPTAGAMQESFVKTGIATVDTARQTLETAYNRQIADLESQKADIQKQIDAATAGQQTALAGEKSVADDKYRQMMDALNLEKQRTDDAYNARVSLTNQLQSLLQQGQDFIMQQKNATGLGPIKDPRLAQSMSDVAAQAGVIQATLAAYDGNIAAATTILNNTVNTVNAATQDQLGYYKDLYNFYVDEKNIGLDNLKTLTSDQRKFIDAKIGQLENDLKITQDNAQRMRQAMMDPDTALAYGQAGVTLNDTPEQVAQKLSRWGYAQEISKQSNDMAKEGYTAVVPGQKAPAGAQVVTLTDSQGRTKQWYKVPEATYRAPLEVSPGASLYDPVTGEYLGTAPMIDKDTGLPVAGGGAVGTAKLPTQQDISNATQIVNLGMEILSNTDGINQAIGPVKGRLPTLRGAGADLVAKLNSLIGQEALKNMGLIKGVLSDSDMALLKSASTGGLSRVSTQETFTNTLKGMISAAMAVQLAPRLSQELGSGELAWINEDESMYAYRNNDGSLHVGYKDDGYIDSTVARDFNNVGGGTYQASSIQGRVAQKYPDGFKGGQCGDFAHKIVDFPPVGDSKKSKINSVAKYGIPANQWRQSPRVGDVIITGENPTYGHVAVVNAVFPDGRIQLTESNYKQSEKVSNDRIISINNPNIYGAIRGKLKV